MKVEAIYKVTLSEKPFEQYQGFCPACNALVRMDAYGVDEKCPKCKEWLEWDVKNNSISERDWRDELKEEREFIYE